MYTANLARKIFGEPVSEFFGEPFGEPWRFFALFWRTWVVHLTFPIDTRWLRVWIEDGIQLFPPFNRLPRVQLFARILCARQFFSKAKELLFFTGKS